MQRGKKSLQLRQVSSPKKVHDSLFKLRDELVLLESAATAGGGATEADLVVDGLKEDDQILSMNIKTQGANAVALAGRANQEDGEIDVEFTANPGAGAVVTLLVRRSILK